MNLPQFFSLGQPGYCFLVFERNTVLLFIYRNNENNNYPFTDLHLGPTFNVSVADSNPDMGQMAWNEIPPYSFYNRTSNNYEQTNVQMWVGLQGSIHF